MKGVNRDGVLLIGVLLLLFILSTLVSAAAVAVRASFSADKRFTRTSLLGRALDAGVARGRARVASDGPKALDFEGTLQEASFHVRGDKLDDNTYRLTVVSENETGQKARCRVTLRVRSHDADHSTEILQYQEPEIGTSRLADISSATGKED